MKSAISFARGLPAFKGAFDGWIDLGHIPDFLKELIPFSVDGLVKGKSTFDFSLGDICLERLHKIRLGGNLELTNFAMKMPEDTLSFAAHRASLALDSPIKISSDSTLRADVQIDSAKINFKGLDLKTVNFRCKVASYVGPTSADTSIINPLSVDFDAQELSMRSDSSYLGFGKVICHTSLQRWKHRLKAPLLGLDLLADSLAYITPGAEARLAKAKIKANARLDKREPYPGGYAVPIGDNIVDFGLSETLRKLIDNWGVDGSVSAVGARYYTRAFPVQTKLDSIDIVFNPDSMEIVSGRCRAGNSDVRLQGLVSNLRHALGGTRQPLKVDLDILSDTLDLNQLARVGSPTGKESAEMSSGTSNSDSKANAFSDTVAPMLLPMNLDLNLNVNAHTIMYYTVVLYDLGTKIRLNQGCLDIDTLNVLTDMGNLDLKMRYKAARPDSMEIAAEGHLSSLDIKEMVHLVPYVDSILPMLHDFGGTIDVALKASSKIGRDMCMVKKSIVGDVSLVGHKLTIQGIDKLEKIEKLLPKKDRPITIDRLSVDIKFGDGHMDVYPYLINIKNIWIAASESDDGPGNIDVELSFLRSFIPWKWGFEFNEKNGHKHIHFGGAKLHPGIVARSYSLEPYTFSVAKYVGILGTDGARIAREGHIVPGQTNPRE